MGPQNVLFVVVRLPTVKWAFSHCHHYAKHDKFTKSLVFLYENNTFGVAILRLYMMTMPRCLLGAQIGHCFGAWGSNRIPFWGFGLILRKPCFSYRKTNNLARPSCLPTWGYTWWRCQNVYFPIVKATFSHCHHVCHHDAILDDIAKTLVFL